MRVKNTLGLLILAFLFTTAVSVAVAQDCVSIDLGEINIESGLQQVETDNDTRTEVATIDGIECRKGMDLMSYMHFGCNDTAEGNAMRDAINASGEVWIGLKYYDTDQPAEQGIWFEYVSTTGPWTRIADADWYDNPGTNTWDVHVWHITDAAFGDYPGATKSADIRFNRRNGLLGIDIVAFCLTESAAEVFATGPSAVEPTMKLATTWGALKR